ncbi:MAG: sigma-70 family RNA polymerase sigma factor [Polyangiaceae bacterium]|nr:sigma-70 family RNA polymerase sigma factor [Polyangiaceae bacterium]
MEPEPAPKSLLFRFARTRSASRDATPSADASIGRVPGAADESAVSPSDEELLAAWSAGDSAAGSALFDRHFASLYRFFRNKAPDAVEDLIQETMLATTRAKSGFRGESSFRTYLFTVARHELYAHFEKRRRTTAKQEDIGEQSVADLATSPSGALARRRDQDLLLRALRAIPLDLQVILELAYFEELAGPEIASIVGIPEGTVRSRLRRAKEAVREKMEALATAGDEEALSASQQDFDGWARHVATSLEEGE